MSTFDSNYLLRTRLWQIVLLCFLISTSGISQYQIGLIPRISPDRTISQVVGFTKVEVTYGSPAVNGRQIWGGLVPYGKVWRAGANNATTIHFSDSVLIGGQVIDSGKYALFIIPESDESWQLILNKKYKQWGAFKYNSDEDVIRTPVSPRFSEDHTEQLTYSINQNSFEQGSIELKWGDMMLNLDFKTSYMDKFIRSIEERAQNQPDYLEWVVWIQGAEHLINIENKTDLALLWLERSEDMMNVSTEWNDQFYPKAYIEGHLYWTKARLFALRNDHRESLSLIERIKAIDNPIFYEKHKSDISNLTALIESENTK